VQAQRKAAREEDLRANALLAVDAALAEAKRAGMETGLETAAREAAEARCAEKLKVLEDANRAAVADVEAKAATQKSRLKQRQ